MESLLTQEQERSLYYGHDLTKYLPRTDAAFKIDLIDNYTDEQTPENIKEVIKNRFFIGSRSVNFTLFHAINYMLGTPFFRSVEDIANCATNVFNFSTEQIPDILDLIDVFEFVKTDLFADFIFKKD